MVNYAIISPVRNEEKLIEKTIESVINQTNKPSEWILVNDGSTDNTEKIISRYQKKHKWIKVINLKDRGYYFPGTGVVNTFYKGYDSIESDNWEYVVKLDCDLSFENNYFENIFNEFNTNEKLGIASGCTFIPNGKGLIKEKTQIDHPCGPSKIYKKECFLEIEGLKPIPGWDLADVLSAQMKGWETRCFEDYKILHFRGTGLRRPGFTKGRFLWGQFHYRYGYSLLYVFLKSVIWLGEKPPIIGGIGIFSGYIQAAITRKERLFDKDMRKFLRRKQRKYLSQRITQLFK